MGVTSMMGFAADEVSVAVTVRTMPVSAASSPCVCRWASRFGTAGGVYQSSELGTAEHFAVERNDSEGQVIRLERFSTLSFAN